MLEYGVIPSVSDPGVTTETPPSPGMTTEFVLPLDDDIVCVGIANVVEVVVPWLKNLHSLLSRKPEVFTVPC